VNEWQKEIDAEVEKIMLKRIYEQWQDTLMDIMNEFGNLEELRNVYEAIEKKKGEV